MRFALALMVAALTLSLVRAADDILIADFDGDTYGDWKLTGTAFGTRPARGTLPNQMPVSGYLGKGLVNSYFGGDKSIGTLTSPPFKVQRRYINFLIGGGGYPGETCINLLKEGKVVRTATGPNNRSGGTEELDWHAWDVSEFAGKDVVIQIVDTRTGGWGHINIDHIYQSDTKQNSGPVTRDFVIARRYLHLPVKTGASKKRLTFLVEGKVVREFDIELSDAPGFFTFADVAAFRGKTLTVSASKLPEGPKLLEKVTASDELPGRPYREKDRPQFHFTSRVGWLNDPNGLVYLDGEYHLFYQHNPYGWNWGNMHWGHAVSKDLVHWKELPIALYPRRHGDWCFSGSAVVDKANTGGWKTGDADVMVAAFTSTGRGECIVYSNDRGRTWKEHEGNPVVKHAGRDPKVIWHEPTKKWVMAVYDEFESKRWIAFHSSPDLRKWTFESRIEGFFECPDLFPLTPQGKHAPLKWVLYAADGKYVLGDFDGKKFTVESGKHQLWHGQFYAAQSYSDAPDGRRIQIGWNNGAAFPGMPFNQQMTVPVDLSLRATPDGLRLFAEPVKELDSLSAKTHFGQDVDLKPGGRLFDGSAGDLFDIRVEFEPGTAESFAIAVRGSEIVYDVKKRELSCRGHRAPLAPVDSKITLRALVDRGSIEVFGNGGRVAVSAGGTHPEKNLSLGAHCKGGTVKVKSWEVRELKSAWD